MGKVLPVEEYCLTAHARFDMERRGTGEGEVAPVLSAPEHAEGVRRGRVIYQWRFERGDPSRIYLLQVFVDVDREPAKVVTAYWSSKVENYWNS